MKSHRYSGRLTEAIYTVTTDYIKEQNQLPEKHRVSVSGVLRHLGVSRSGYHAWRKRKPSFKQRRKVKIKEKIQQIYDESHQIYGAPQISWVLNRTLEAVHVVDAVKKAMKARDINTPLVFHSDRGVQYVCSHFRKVTGEYDQ